MKKWLKNKLNWYKYSFNELKFYFKRIFRKTEAVEFFAEKEVLKKLGDMSKKTCLSIDDVVTFILYQQLELLPTPTKKKKPKKKKKVAKKKAKKKSGKKSR